MGQAVPCRCNVQASEKQQSLRARLCKKTNFIFILHNGVKEPKSKGRADIAKLIGNKIAAGCYRREGGVERKLANLRPGFL